MKERNWMNNRSYYDKSFTRNVFGKEMTIIGEIPAQRSIRPFYIVKEEKGESYVDREGADKRTSGV